MKIKQKLTIRYIRVKFKLLTLVSNRKAAEKAFELFCTPFFKSGKKPAGVFQEAKKLDYSLNGQLVKGYIFNNGMPVKVLILHGFGSAAYKFHSYIKPLVACGFEVLAFDAPAHGDSEGKTVNVVEYCQLIELIIKKNGPINAFIAHSFGGIALSLALEKTEHDKHTKVVLIAPATETTTAIDSAFKMLAIKSKNVREEFNKIIFERSGHHPEWFSIKRAMQHIKASVLWIHDEDDTITPLKDALKIKADHPANIKFIITKGLGHRNIYRSTEIKNKVLHFLKPAPLD